MNQNSKKNKGIVLLAVAVLLIAAIVFGIILTRQAPSGPVASDPTVRIPDRTEENPGPTEQVPRQTEQLPLQTNPISAETQAPTETQKPDETRAPDETQAPTETPVPTEPQVPEETRTPNESEHSGSTVPTGTQTDGPVDLGYGLQIIDSGSYTGVYVEDGSNANVQNVMMIIVSNDGEQDIQLADITADCDGEEYHFRLTNLAVGARAVLLDRDRRQAAGALSSASLSNTALFEAPMQLHEDRLQISGEEGTLSILNISGTDISADLYVLYKYVAEDLYFGGITFRVRVEGGMKAGEVRHIPAGHYSPETCEIVQVSIYE